MWFRASVSPLPPPSWRVVISADRRGMLRWSWLSCSADASVTPSVVVVVGAGAPRGRRSRRLRCCSCCRAAGRHCRRRFRWSCPSCDVVVVVATALRRIRMQRPSVTQRRWWSLGRSNENAVGQYSRAPKLVEVKFADAGRSLVSLGPDVAEIGPMLLKLTRSWPTSCKRWSSLSKVGRTQPEFGRVRDTLVEHKAQ